MSENNVTQTTFRKTEEGWKADRIYTTHELAGILTPKKEDPKPIYRKSREVYQEEDIKKLEATLNSFALDYEIDVLYGTTGSKNIIWKGYPSQFKRFERN